MTLAEKKSELAKTGKTLRYVCTRWTRYYVSRRGEIVDDDRAIWEAARNVPWADYYILTPSWRSTQYCYRQYYKIVDLADCK